MIKNRNGPNLTLRLISVNRRREPLTDLFLLFGKMRALKRQKCAQGNGCHEIIGQEMN